MTWSDQAVGEPMRYLALATDYDGTLAHDGRVDGPTLAGLERLLASGRRLIMVTGRELDDLAATFDHLDLFERVVAENGAILYHPAAKSQRVLAPAPPDEFVRALRLRGVPLSAGRTIVATWKPHETAVLETIRDLGLDSQVIFNKDAVMVLPAGVTKASGLEAALDDLGLSRHDVVGIGDAENDHAFLRICECAVAVANALPALKQLADFTTRADHGAAVVELIDEIILDDLAGREPLLGRHHVLLGTRELPPDRSFYFRGPEGKLNLRAQNLMMFLQMADGVDDDTWFFHLRRGDYEQWFRDRIKDDQLADEAAEVARRPMVSAAESRELIRAAVERRYTQAVAPLPGTNLPR